MRGSKECLYEPPWVLWLLDDPLFRFLRRLPASGMKGVSMIPQKFTTTVRSKRRKDESQAKEDIFVIERRRHPRVVVEFPFDYSRTDGEEKYGGFATNASEGGLLVYLPEVIEKGTSLKIIILFLKGSALNTIKCIAKVVWCNLAAKAAWGEHRYGLEFQSFYKGSLDELNILLKKVAEAHTG